MTLAAVSHSCFHYNVYNLNRNLIVWTGGFKYKKNYKSNKEHFRSEKRHCIVGSGFKFTEHYVQLFIYGNVININNTVLPTVISTMLIPSICPFFFCRLKAIRKKFLCHSHFLIIKSRIKSLLYSGYYIAYACNEGWGPSTRHSAGATQLRRNVAAVASCWRHCLRFHGQIMKPRTTRASGNVVSNPRSHSFKNIATIEFWCGKSSKCEHVERENVVPKRFDCRHFLNEAYTLMQAHS